MPTAKFNEYGYAYADLPDDRGPRVHEVIVDMKFMARAMVLIRACDRLRDKFEILATEGDFPQSRSSEWGEFIEALNQLQAPKHETLAEVLYDTYLSAGRVTRR